MIEVRVPATSANMGAGFDCLGVAISLYNTVTVEEIPQGIIIENKNIGEFVPPAESNLLYRAMKVVFDKTDYNIKGIRAVQKSEIPMTRGLGSSSACIIAGMLAANVMSGRKLSYSEILNMAAVMEGHPDNVTPALYGGFCAAVKSGGSVIAKSVKIEKPLVFEVMIPDFYVSTKMSRVRLPEKVTHKDAAYNAGNAALFALALATGDFDKLQTAVRDKLHQPYRAAYIDNMDEIFEESYKNGAYAVWLSGSGPTIVAIHSADNTCFAGNMNSYFTQCGLKRTCKSLSIDNVGSVVKEI